MDYQKEIDKFTVAINNAINERHKVTDERAKLSYMQFDNGLAGKQGALTRKINKLKRAKLSLVCEYERMKKDWRQA